MKIQLPKFVGCSKGNAQREIFSCVCLDRISLRVFVFCRLTFYFDKIVHSHARQEITVRCHRPLIQFSPVVTSCITISQLGNGCNLLTYSGVTSFICTDFCVCLCMCVLTSRQFDHVCRFV